METTSMNRFKSALPLKEICIYLVGMLASTALLVFVILPPYGFLDLPMMSLYGLAARVIVKIPTAIVSYRMLRLFGFEIKTRIAMCFISFLPLVGGLVCGFLVYIWLQRSMDASRQQRSDA